MSITVIVTLPRRIAAANEMWRRAVDGSSVADFVQRQVDNMLDSWAETTGVDRIPVGAFVRRFPGGVMDAVNASADPNVVAILAQLDAVQTVRLGHPTTLQGVGYLVAQGYLTQAQADVVLHYDVPTVP